MRVLFALAAATCAAGLANAQLQTIVGSGTANGNGSTSFGGELGTGSIDVQTFNNGDVFVTLNLASDINNDTVVVYFDTITGGASSTSTITNTGGDSGNAIAGTSVLNFATGFEADFALTFEANVFFAGGAFLFDLTNGSTDFLDSVGDLSTTNNGTEFDQFGADSLTAKFNLADIGLSAGDTFDFVANLSNTGGDFRSGEFVGVAQSSGFPNDPFVGAGPFTLADDDFIRVISNVPAPGAVAVLGLAGVASARRRR
ncbi:MAG: hypothetical protein AAGI30_02365 [Planctomycetota bacterium]